MDGQGLQCKEIETVTKTPKMCYREVKQMCEHPLDVDLMESIIEMPLGLENTFSQTP
jgi:hypothetical protein